MIEANLPTLTPAAFETLLEPAPWHQVLETLAAGRAVTRDRTWWHMNSTLRGGGVAELLGSVLGYAVGAGIRTRWAAIEGCEPFFVITKRVHRMLHGDAGAGGTLSDADHRTYTSVLEQEWTALEPEVQPGDVVVLHDPQVVGLAPALVSRGAIVIWNCHVGADDHNEVSERAHAFLLPYVSACAAVVFSCRRHVWPELAGTRVVIVPPCIDACSPKNGPMSPESVSAIMSATGIVPAPPCHGADASFTRRDGTKGRVSTKAALIETSPVPSSAPLVTQISRWDPLKDHAGLAEAFAFGDIPPEAHLVLAGPARDGVDDDPEDSATFEALRRRWAELPATGRARVHIASLPMADVDENAAIVNALQRRSDVVVQKSLAEGFGLTVAEALWKQRPTVATAVGGIQEQIVDGESGLLVEDPADRGGVAKAITALLADPAMAARLAHNGKNVVTERFLAPSWLGGYLALAASLTGRG